MKTILCLVCVLAALGTDAQSHREKRLEEQRFAEKSKKQNDKIVEESKKPEAKAEEVTTAKKKVKTIFSEDADFLISESPAAFKNESAVILCQKSDNAYSFTQSDACFAETNRRRIILLDKSSLKEYSTIRFTQSPDAEFELRVIKPGGAKAVFTLNDAIMEDQTEKLNNPSYAANFYAEPKDYKLAIPDLEIGDIIDYTTIETTKRRMDYNKIDGKTVILFPPNIVPLTNKYPIAKQKFIFSLDPKYSFSFKAMQGSPAIARIDSSANKVTYSLSDSMRQRTENERWDFPLRSGPVIKYQVIFAESVKNMPFLLGAPNKITQSVTKEEMAEKIKNLYFYYKKQNPVHTSAVLENMRRSSLRSKENEKIVSQLYYHMRYLLTKPNLNLSDNELMFIFIDCLKKYDIESEILVTASRKISTLDHLLLTPEMMVFLKVNGRYIFPPSGNSHLYEVPSDFIGQEAIRLGTIKEDAEKIQFDKFVIPVSAPEENMNIETMEISASPEFERMRMKHKTVSKGLVRFYVDVHAMSALDFETEDCLMLGIDPPVSKNALRGRHADKVEENARRQSQEKAQEKKQFLENLKKDLEEDYKDVGEVDSALVISGGRTHDSSSLICYAEYSVGDVFKKIGPNYSVALGMMVGKQAELKEEEIRRQRPVFIDFPKTFQYHIKFQVPQGYTAEGLESMNMNVSNKAGSFVSDVKLEGGAVVIDAKKIYKVCVSPIEDWDLYRAFLDAAYNFTQKKIILKKKG